MTAVAEEQELDEIQRLLSDKWWRMDNLYKVENERGELVTFKLRPAQRLLFELMHWLNIILKARQLGFSTAIDIYLLDEALFNKNMKCGIIAQDQQAAGEIFQKPSLRCPWWLHSFRTRLESASRYIVPFRHRPAPARFGVRQNMR
jgi:hypothetical protein